MMAKAYDAAEHVSSAYGFFADDSQWDWLSELFGKKGTKQIPFAGYYTGYDRASRKRCSCSTATRSRSTARRPASRFTGASSP